MTHLYGFHPGEVGISAEQIDGLEGLGYVGSPKRRPMALWVPWLAWRGGWNGDLMMITWWKSCISWGVYMSL